MPASLPASFNGNSTLGAQRRKRDRAPAEQAGSQAGRCPRAALEGKQEGPGEYFRRCRQRGDLTTFELGRLLSSGVGRLYQAESEILALEAETPGDYAALAFAVQRRRALAGFSLSHFFALCAATCSPAGEAA